MVIRDFMTSVGRLFDKWKLAEAGPSLAPAVKHLPTGRIYRGKVGQMHHHVGEAAGLFGVGWKENPDLMLGFMNHKGQFLTRKRALDYAKTHDMMHDMAKRYIATDDAPAELGASFLKKH